MIPLLGDVTNAKVQRVPFESNSVERVQYVTGSINNLYKIKLVSSLINYLHCVAISVPISLWYEAVGKGFFTTWSGLSTKRIKRHCKKKITTAQGDMQLVPSNVQSRRLKPLKKRNKNHKVGVFLVDDDDMKNLIVMDFAEQYPVTSKQGHKYIFIMYDYNSNYTFVVPVKSRKTSEYLRAFQEYYDKLKQRGFTAQIL